MESRHGVHTHAHRALREDARLSFSQPAGGTCDTPPMRRGALARWGGGGELRFRGRVWVLFGVGLCCGGEGRGMLRENCSGDGGDFDEWTPAMTILGLHRWRRCHRGHALPFPVLARLTHLSTDQPSLTSVRESHHIQPRFTFWRLEFVGAS